MKRKITNQSKEFYRYLGPVFGSRKIQKETKDRFYDDDGKEWIIDTEEEEIRAVISIQDKVIKNVYIQDQAIGIKILQELYETTNGGIVPAIYKICYKSSGFEIKEKSANFVEIRGGYYEKRD